MPPAETDVLPVTAFVPLAVTLSDVTADFHDDPSMEWSNLNTIASVPAPVSLNVTCGAMKLDLVHGMETVKLLFVVVADTLLVPPFNVVANTW